MILHNEGEVYLTFKYSWSWNLQERENFYIFYIFLNSVFDRLLWLSPSHQGVFQVVILLTIQFLFPLCLHFIHFRGVHFMSHNSVDDFLLTCYSFFLLLLHCITCYCFLLRGADNWICVIMHILIINSAFYIFLYLTPFPKSRWLIAWIQSYWIIIFFILLKFVHFITKHYQLTHICSSEILITL